MKRFGVRVYKGYFNFSSAHFLIFTDGTREELHGHNYQVRVKVLGEISEGDMVVDFCKLKPIVKRFCDGLDHRTLLAGRSPNLEIREEDDHVEAVFTRSDGGRDRFMFPQRDVLVLPLTNTSTERLAELLGDQIFAAVREEADPGARLESLEIEVEEAGGQCGLYGVDAPPIIGA
jgi:6-pyruvoyltetrahydropterin/6-carboxytetrahydropterin synthase